MRTKPLRQILPTRSFAPKAKSKLIERMQKNQGPKSELGKSRSRLNALKHGLFARSVLSTLPPSEKREYTKLFRDLANHYQPANVMEELLVEEIAGSLWRLSLIRRVDDRMLRVLELSVKEAWDEANSSIGIPYSGERISQYASRYERNLYKATAELRRQQAARLAATAPSPPVNSVTDDS